MIRTRAYALALVSLILAPISPSAPWTPAEDYRSPVTPFRVVRLADLPAQPWLPGHRGVDLAADVGDTVHAPAAGIVTFAGTVVDRDVVSVRHPDGAISSMEPVDAAVVPGQAVGREEVVGTVQDLGTGNGHCRPDSCLHWGVRVDGEYIDPLDVLEGFGIVRLLPRSESAFAPRRASGLRRSARAARLPSAGRAGGHAHKSPSHCATRHMCVRRTRPCP